MDIEAIKAKYLVNDVRDPLEKFSFLIGVKATVVDDIAVFAKSRFEAQKKAKELFKRKNPKLNITNIET